MSTRPPSPPSRPDGPGVPAARDRLLGAAIAYFAAHGIGDTSLRGLAEAIGTSHRMLIYHFGSRDGLLAAVVDRVEQAQRDALAALTATRVMCL